MWGAKGSPAVGLGTAALAGGAAVGIGLGAGTLINQKLGVRKAWMGRYDKKDAAADSAISQGDIAANRKRLGLPAGPSQTITITNLNVNADDVLTADKLGKTLAAEANKRMQ